MRQLTNEHVDMGPRWSPDGRELIFYSKRSGKLEVWRIQPDGSGIRQLTETPDRTQCQQWSPDGKRVVYCSGGDTYVFRPGVPWQEQSAEKLPRPPEGRFVPTSWSSDGERIAGDLQHESKAGQVAVLSLGSREYDVFGEGAGPVWLSDNRRLLFLGGACKVLGKFMVLVEGGSGGNRDHVPSRRRPVEDDLRGQGRYQHLFEPTRNEQAIRRIQQQVDSYWEGVAG